MQFKEFMEKYNLKLNDKQIKAVKETEGPVLLLAVPGSGKTTVLVSRLAYMIYCRGISPRNILTLTYTVASAVDMKRRFISLFGDEVSDAIEFRTINSVCYQIIKHYGRMIGRPSFELESDEKVLSKLLADIFLNVQHVFASESDLQNIRRDISYIKNMELNVDEIRELEQDRDYQLSDIYDAYQETLKKNRLMDYDDQMVYAKTLLTKSPELLQYFQAVYQYICVDEAQDTSKIQHEIIAMLAGDRDNLFMVGDEDQSIYGFRAAYPDAIMQFEKNHKNAKVLMMETNYRSDAGIVKIADRFIQKNMYRYEKHMHAVRPESRSVNVIKAKSSKAQDEYIKRIAKDCNVSTACLYRNNECALPIIDLLEREGVDYRIRNAELSFFSHKIINDIRDIAYFSRNRKDEETYMRIYYKIWPFLNKEKAMKACVMARKNDMDILDAVIEYAELKDSLIERCIDVKSCMRDIPYASAHTALVQIENMMGYSRYLTRAKINDSKLGILKRLALNEENLESLMNRLDDLKEIISSKDNDRSCMFTLSTIHSSKGLEYTRVYLIDVYDGILPEKLPDSLSDKDYQEERRLFYVGMTRAKDELYLIKTDKTSSFIEEVQTGKQSLPRKPDTSFGKDYSYTSGPEITDHGLKKGTHVIHSKLGEGIVLFVSGKNVKVRFTSDTKVFDIDTVIKNGILRVE